MVDIFYRETKLNKECTIRLTSPDVLPISNDFNEMTNTALMPTYMSLDGQGIDLYNIYNKFYEQGDYVGYISKTQSDEQGNISIELDFDVDLKKIKADENLYFYFYDCHPKEVSAIFIDVNGWIMMDEHGTYLPEQNAFEIPLKNIVDGDSSGEPMPVQSKIESKPSGGFIFSLKTIKLFIKGLNEPFQHVKISNYSFGETKTKRFDKIKNISYVEEVDLSSTDLPSNQLDFSVITKESLKRDAMLSLYSNGKFLGLFFIDKLKKVGATQTESVYDISAKDILYLFERKETTLFRSIDLQTEINRYIKMFPYGVSTFSSEKPRRVYGFIEKRNLRQMVCSFGFACGQYITASRSTSLKFCDIPMKGKLKNKITANDILGESIFEEKAPVTKIVKSYPYDSLDLKGSQRTYTYDEEPYTSFFILFGKPIVVKSLTGGVLCDLDGTASEQNLSSGNYDHFNPLIDVGNSNTVSITVQDVDVYTREVSFNNNVSANENVKEYKDFNVSGFVSGTKPLEKTQGFDVMFKSKGVIKARIILKDRQIGDLVQIETAFDGVMVGIITKIDYSFGYKTVADVEITEYGTDFLLNKAGVWE